MTFQGVLAHCGVCVCLRSAGRCGVERCGWRCSRDPTQLCLAAAVFEHPGQGETRGCAGWVVRGWATARWAGLAASLHHAQKRVLTPA